MRKFLLCKVLIVVFFVGCSGVSPDPVVPPAPYQSIFTSANDFPIPHGSKIIAKNIPAKGSRVTIAFYSKLSLQELMNFYLSEMTQRGCRENPSHYILTQQAMNVAFACVRDYAEDVYVNVGDMAYSSAEDIRMASASFSIRDR
jgi:hypothetical protein